MQKFNNHGNYKYYRNLANWLNTAKNRRISTIYKNDLNSKLNVIHQPGIQYSYQITLIQSLSYMLTNIIKFICLF